MTNQERCRILADVFRNICQLNGIQRIPFFKCEAQCDHDGYLCSLVWCPYNSMQGDLQDLEANGRGIKIDFESLHKLVTTLIQGRYEHNTAAGDAVAQQNAVDVRPVLTDEQRRLMECGIGERDTVDVIRMCKGCRYYDSIQMDDDGKPRCGALTATFFHMAFCRSRCAIRRNFGSA